VSEFRRADKLAKEERKVYIKKFSNADRKYRMLVMKVNDAFSVLSLNSSSGVARQYTVRWDGEGWTCSCPDFAGKEKSYTCKHIEAVFAAELKGERCMEVEVNGRNRA